ncbi:MAG: cation diffusion facilitator family transporter [Oligosphaeraceae bacterium]
MSHCHHHHHTHGVEGEGKASVLLAAILLNVVFAAGEFWAGVVWHSSGLKADAGHNLGDVGGLVISLLAILLLRVPPRGRFTYGLKRGTVLASLLNGILLTWAALLILWECVQRFSHPLPVQGWGVGGMAFLGILVNGGTVWLLGRQKHRDLNLQGAFLHMVADTLVSAGVLVAGVLVELTGWNPLDPLVGVAVALLILVSSWGLLKESLCLALDAAPEGENPQELRQKVAGLPGVRQVSRLRLRALSTTEGEAILHVAPEENADLRELGNAIRELLPDSCRHNLHLVWERDS